MKFRTIACWGARALALVGLALAPLAHAQTQADVQLQTDLQHMSVQVNQGAPLPPGGCIAGYSWHTVYGGCRRAETQSETTQCPDGYVGTQVRYRTAYILQANPADVAHEDWGPWQQNCQAPRGAGVVDTVIAKARGAEYSGTNNFKGTAISSSTHKQIWKGMQVNYGTMYGVTLYRPAATLTCLWAIGSTAGSGNSTGTIWSGSIASPGQSVTNGYAGHCQLSNGGKTAELTGSCDNSTGGDADMCESATRVVNVIAVDGCSATTETREGKRVVATNSYNLCL